MARGAQDSSLPGSPEGKGFVVTQIWQSQYACEPDPPQTTWWLNVTSPFYILSLTNFQCLRGSWKKSHKPNVDGAEDHKQAWNSGMIRVQCQKSAAQLLQIPFGHSKPSCSDLKPCRCLLLEYSLFALGMVIKLFNPSILMTNLWPCITVFNVNLNDTLSLIFTAWITLFWLNLARWGS